MEGKFQGEIIFWKTRTKQTRTNKSACAGHFFYKSKNCGAWTKDKKASLTIILGLRERDKMNKKDKTDRHGRLGKLKKLGQHT